MDGVLHELLRIVNTTNPDDTYHRIAVILVKNIMHVSNMGITQIAELCYVSPATLSRFFRDIGFKNFSEFKSSLDRHYGFDIDYTKQYRDLDISALAKLGALRTQTINNLEDIGQTLGYKDLDRLVRLIHESSEVVFFGHMVYQFVMLYLQQRLSLFGKYLRVNTDTLSQIEEAHNIDKSSLAIAYSPRGQSLVNSGVMAELYKREVKTVLITQNPNPPFAERYTKLIYMGGTPDNNLSMISLMYLIDQIVLLYYTFYHDELIV